MVSAVAFRSVPQCGVAEDDLVLRKAREMFPIDQVGDVIALLGEQPDVRVQLAILKVSEGTMDRLLVWLDEARKDWRDVLVAAEYSRQASYRPGEAPEEVIAADLAEYAEWLGE